MKIFLLVLSFVFSSLQGSTQNGGGGVNALPAGRYETMVKPNGGKWNKGDIVLLPGNRYKLTTSEEEGEYKFSEMAQRIFFVSGPLKTVFAKTTLSGNKPVIIIPAAENEQQGLKLAAADVYGYLKK